MKKILWLLPILALLLGAASDPVDPIRLTIINKSDMDIAVQLQGITKVCCNKSDTQKGEFYYLRVAAGSRALPTTKTFIIERDTYTMQMFFIQTWDPVYGFKCDSTVPNVLTAGRNLRLVVLPCGELPKPCAVGEPSMWKYIPYPVPELSRIFNPFWRSRLIY